MEIPAANPSPGEVIEAAIEPKVAQVHRAFTYHPPKGDQPMRYVRIRDEGRSLADTLLLLCPDSRERSLALTRLEEVVMWANAAIARNE